MPKLVPSSKLLLHASFVTFKFQLRQNLSPCRKDLQIVQTVHP